MSKAMFRCIPCKDPCLVCDTLHRPSRMPYCRAWPNWAEIVVCARPLPDQIGLGAQRCGFFGLQVFGGGVEDSFVVSLCYCFFFFCGVGARGGGETSRAVTCFWILGGSHHALSPRLPEVRQELRRLLAHEMLGSCRWKPLVSARLVKSSRSWQPHITECVLSASSSTSVRLGLLGCSPQNLWGRFAGSIRSLQGPFCPKVTGGRGHEDISGFQR